MRLSCNLEIFLVFLQKKEKKQRLDKILTKLLNNLPGKQKIDLTYLLDEGKRIRKKVTKWCPECGNSHILVYQKKFRDKLMCWIEVTCALDSSYCTSVMAKIWQQRLIRWCDLSGKVQRKTDVLNKSDSTSVITWPGTNRAIIHQWCPNLWLTELSYIGDARVLTEVIVRWPCLTMVW